MLSNILESTFLIKLSSLSGKDLIFKDELVLPGTAWIYGIPIDVKIRGRKLVINSIGEFSGDAKSFSRSINRGSGKFRELVPYIKESLIFFDMELRMYLTPLSPVWKNNYKLVLDPENYNSTKCSWFIDLS